MIFLDKSEFGQFLRRKRMEQDFNLASLAEGLCSFQAINKIEQGKSFPKREVRERLIERLGESAYDYENYVEAKDYKEWKLETALLDALNSAEISKAQQLLQTYEGKYKKRNVVTQQFYTVMLLQLLELKNASKEEKAVLLEQAVKLTIPNIDEKSISDLILSISELNLVLEYVTYQKKENLQEKYEELFQYMEREKFDLESRALFSSKLTLYFCEYQWEIIKGEEKVKAVILAQGLLEKCSKAIEHLRNHKKIYFAWELLQMEQKILSFLLKEKELCAKENIEYYEKEQEQTKSFLEVLNRLYETYQIPKQTNKYTIFYQKREIYCINDVIRARRKMFQVSLEELEDICDIKTIRRLENKTTKTQLGVVKRLFHRFHLSTEMERSVVVTSSEKAIRLEQKLRVTMNQREYEPARELLQALKELISMEELINKQYMEYKEVQISHGRKELTKEQFIQKSIQILEYTMPLKFALRPFGEIKSVNGKTKQEEKYFTKTEITILYNIITQLDDIEKEPYFSILKEYFERLENERTIVLILGMYGLVMEGIASDLGNQGKYEESIEINRKIVEQSLKWKHLEYIEENIYGLMWNEEKRKGLSEKENPERIVCMQDCIVIDSYNRDKVNENWMKTKLKGILDI